MEIIEAIIRSVNWYVIRKMMRVSGHRWAKQKGKRTVLFLPDEAELQQTARRILTRALKEGGTHRAGGLTACREGNLLSLEYCGSRVEQEVDA